MINQLITPFSSAYLKSSANDLFFDAEGSSELDGFFAKPEDGPPKWLLVLTAYLDESGHEGNGHVFIAGYLGNERQWKNLVIQWKNGLGRKKSFHACNLRWSSARTRKLLAGLGPIPEACGLTPLFGGVRVSDYFDIVQGTNIEKYAKGFNLALLPLIIRTVELMPKEARVEFFFEQQNEYEFGVNQILNCISQLPLAWARNSDGKSKIARWGFVPKKSTMLTEPADYLSYALTQIYRDKHSLKSNWCMPILAPGKGVGRVMSREEIRNTLKFLEQAAGGFNSHPPLEDFKRMIQGNHNENPKPKRD